MKIRNVELRSTATLVWAVLAALLVYLPVSTATAQRFPPPIPADPADSCPWDTTGVFNETTGVWEGDGVVVHQYNPDGQWNPDGYTLSDLFACWYAMNGRFWYPAEPDGSGSMEIEVSLALFPRCDIDGDGVVSFIEIFDIMRHEGDCQTACNYHSDCAADEYCAGDGCGANDGTCDPFLPDGVCTAMRDAAECATAPIVPVCGCNAELYLSTCQMESEGARFSNPGICAPVSCSGVGADDECPCNHYCKEAVLGTYQCARL